VPRRPNPARGVERPERLRKRGIPVAIPRPAQRAGLIAFGLRSQIRFAPRKEHLLRLRLDDPARTGTVAVMSLAAHGPSPPARRRVGAMRGMAGSRQLACPPRRRRSVSRRASRRHPLHIH
jgi:hypothetical protein